MQRQGGETRAKANHLAPAACSERVPLVHLVTEHLTGPGGSSMPWRRSACSRRWSASSATVCTHRGGGLFSEVVPGS